MSITEKMGYFQDYYLNIKNSCTEDDLKNFGELRTDEERFKFVSNLKSIIDNEIKVKKEYPGKGEKEAIEFKEKGNEAFKHKKWIDAMIMYSKSYLATPGEKCSDAAIILANRSAALFHMEKYDETLKDIKNAIQKNYPKDLLYKLYERQARCFLAKKNYVEAIESFKKTITALDDSKLPLEKKTKIEKDSMIMIKMLESDPQLKKLAELHKNSGKDTLTQDKEFISSAMAIDYNPQEGRFAKATKNIGVGDDVIIEKPNTFALLEKYCKTHCQHCFKRTVNPVACPNCTDVIFCSEECLKIAVETYHKHECGILSMLWRSGASINCHLALRIISSKSLDYFLKLKNELEKDLSFDELKKLKYDDYRKVYNLVRHEDKRNASSFFQYAIMSYYLLTILKGSGYFNENTSKDDINFIGGLILRNLQFLQFNTHEIFELHKRQSGVALKTVFIGAGVYPTLALFNHSCDPGIVKYYQGNTVHVNAIKPIENGKIIAENYGPLYTQEIRDERQSKLKDLYWFDCSCEACIENWPRYEDMNNNIIRYRCDGEEKCDAVIEIPANCNDFMIKCVKCGQYTNILKGLKVMQDTEMIDKTAKRLYDAGDISKALNKYIDMLKIMNEVLAPPFTDYCQCQQHIKDCFLHYGNSYIISE